MNKTPLELLAVAVAIFLAGILVGLAASPTPEPPCLMEK